MSKRRPENHSNLDSESEPEPESILDSKEFKKAKETVYTNAAIGQAEDKMQKEVYSLLSDHEREEFKALKTPTEKRQYIVRKYSKIFGPES
jgi:hypothetical protein